MIRLFLLVLVSCLKLLTAQMVTCSNGFNGATVQGYETLQGLRNDMQARVDEIASGAATLQDRYEFTLCPETEFDLDAEGELRINLSNSIIQCGPDGDSENECIFAGGQRQIVVEDDSIMGTIQISGITFESFTDTSISLLGVDSNMDVMVQVNACYWQSFTATHAVEQRGPKPPAVNVRDGIWVLGSTSESMFLNENAHFEIHNGLVVRTSTLTNFIETVGADAYSFVNTTVICDNSANGDDFSLIVVRDQARSLILESELLRNAGTEVGIRVEQGAVVNVKDTIFEDNEAINPTVQQSVVGAYNGGLITIEDAVFLRNDNYLAMMMAIFDSAILGERIQITDGSSAVPIFISGDSAGQFSDTTADGLMAQTCGPSPDDALVFLETAFSSECFVTTTNCQGICVSSRGSERGTPCPNDPTIMGFSTLEDLKSDMELEVSLIQSGNAPELTYDYILCPGTTFDLDVAGELVPMLGGMIIKCGSDGAHENDCVFLGGSNQVRIQDPPTGPPLGFVGIMGVTFESFAESSVIAEASSGTTFECMHCIWQDFQSESVVLTTGSNTVILRDALFAVGESSDFILHNEAGRLEIHDSIMLQLEAPMFVSTTGGGTSTLVNSTEICDNDAPSVDFVMIEAANGALTEVMCSCFLRNSGAQVVVRATMESTVEVAGSVFEENSVENPTLRTSVVGSYFMSSVNVLDSTFAQNVGYHAMLLAYSQSTLNGSMVNIQSGRSDLPIFISADSEGSFTDSMADTPLQVVGCQPPPVDMIVFMEDPGSQCYVGNGAGDCTGVCYSAMDGGLTFAGAPPPPAPGPVAPAPAPVAPAPAPVPAGFSSSGAGGGASNIPPLNSAPPPPANPGLPNSTGANNPPPLNPPGVTSSSPGGTSPPPLTGRLGGGAFSQSSSGMNVIGVPDEGAHMRGPGVSSGGGGQPQVQNQFSSSAWDVIFGRDSGRRRLRSAGSWYIL